MIRNYNVFENLHKRETFSANISSPSYFSEKIIKNCFDSTDKFYNLTRDFEQKIVDNFSFSKDGNLLAAGNRVWKLNEDLNFTDSSLLTKTGFFSIGKLCFNVDTSKIYFEVGNYISVYDVPKGESFSLKEKLYPKIITAHPSNPNVFVFNNYANKIFLSDYRSGSRIIKDRGSKIFSLQFNPTKDHLLLVVSKSENGIYTYDLRNHQAVFQYDFLYKGTSDNCYGTYNRKGDKIFLVKDECAPVLFNANEKFPVLYFDDFGYYYSIGLLNCCFAGSNDEYVVASSNNNKIFIWELSKQDLINENISKKKINSAKFILDSPCLVNTVGYNYQGSILASAGKESILTFYSPFPFNLSSRKNFDSKSFSKCPVNSKGKNLCFSSNIKITIDFLLSYGYQKNDEKYGFKYDFENFSDINFENFSTEFLKDLNIKQIKYFIDDQVSNGKKKEEIFIKKLNEFSLKKVINDQYISLVFEVWKIFLNQNFIKNSIFYIKKEQMNKINKLIKIISLNQKKKLVSLEEKSYSLKRINIIFELLIIELEIICCKINLYQDWKNILINLILLYIESNYCTAKKTYEKLLEKFKNKNFKNLNKKKKQFVKETKNFESMKEIEKKLLNEYLNKTLAELNEELILKKKLNNASQIS